MRLATVYQLAKDTGLEFWRDKVPRLGAALAFYTTLSLSPLLLVVMGVAGLVYGEDAARGQIVHQINGLVGDEGAVAVQSMLANNRSGAQSVVAMIVGIATLVFGATGVFAQLQDALDSIWDVSPEKTGGGVWAAIRDRLLSFSLVCGMAFLLLVSLVLSAVLAAMHGFVGEWLPLGEVWLQILNGSISLLLSMALFAMIFKILPHTRTWWSDVWVGAILTAILFNVGKFLIGLYLGRAAVGSSYGAAGSFVVLLVWIYYSTQILLFGAEFTHLYALRHGSKSPAAVGGEPSKTDGG